MEPVALRLFACPSTGSSAGPCLRTLGRNVSPREHDQEDQDRIGSDAYDVRNQAAPLNGLFAHGMSLLGRTVSLPSGELASPKPGLNRSERTNRLGWKCPGHIKHLLNFPL